MDIEEARKKKYDVNEWGQHYISTFMKFNLLDGYELVAAGEKYGADDLHISTTGLVSVAGRMGKPINDSSFVVIRPMWPKRIQTGQLDPSAAAGSFTKEDKDKLATLNIELIPAGTQCAAYSLYYALGLDELIRYHFSEAYTIRADSFLFRYIKPEHKVVLTKKSTERSEGDRLMFFLTGKWPTDPSTLPPPPKILGRTWDELADDC